MATKVVVAELETLFTANVDQVETAEKKIHATGDRVEKNPLKLKADESGALASMNRVEAQAKKLVTADTALKLDADITRAEKSLDRAKQRLADLEVRALGGLDVTADTKRAEAALSKIDRNLAGLKSARTQIEVAADTSDAEKALDGVADKAGDAGSEGGKEAGKELSGGIIAALASIPIAGAIVGIGAVVGKTVVNEFTDALQQEKGRDRLQALTGVSPDEALKFGRAAGEAYAGTFGESIEANMDTTRLALQFRIIDPTTSSKDAQRVVEGLSGISDALEEDVRPTATAVTTLLRTGLAKSADEAFDILAVGATKGLNRAEDLLDTYTEYPVVLKKLGLSGQEATGLINQGLIAGARNTDVVADALKEFQIRATDGSTSSADGFRRLGLNAADSTAKIARGGKDARDGLEEVLRKLRETEDPVKRNAAAVELFGTKAEDMGDALFALDLSRAVAELGGVEGAARRMFDTMASNDATKIEQAGRNIEVAADGIKGALAAGLSDPLGDLADWVSSNRGPVMDFFSDLIGAGFDIGIGIVRSLADGTEGIGKFIGGPLADLAGGLATVLTAIPGQGENARIIGEMAIQMRKAEDTTTVAARVMRERWIPALQSAKSEAVGFADEAAAIGHVNDATLSLAESLERVGRDSEGAKLGLDGFDAAKARGTESGKLLEDQVRRYLGVLGEQISAGQAAKESQEILTGRYNDGRDALIRQMEAMGISREQAQGLIDTVLQTPPEATTSYYSNAPEEQQKVQDLYTRIETKPDGSITIRLDQPAVVAVEEQIAEVVKPRTIAITTAFGSPAEQTARFNSPGAGLLQASGGVVQFMAQGGIPDLTPMAPVAQHVPANTWRVVGDRGDVPESFIPHDGSARSMQILQDTMRMFGITTEQTVVAGGSTIQWSGNVVVNGQALGASELRALIIQVMREEMRNRFSRGGL